MQGILQFLEPEGFTFGELMRNLVRQIWHCIPRRTVQLSIANILALGVIRINEPMKILYPIRPGNFQENRIRDFRWRDRWPRKKVQMIFFREQARMNRLDS